MSGECFSFLAYRSAWMGLSVALWNGAGEPQDLVSWHTATCSVPCRDSTCMLEVGSLQGKDEGF